MLPRFALVAFVAVCLLANFGEQPAPSVEATPAAVPGIMLWRSSAADPWQRLPVDVPTQPGVQLLCLPGSAGEVRLANGVRMTLWGSLPEFSGSPALTMLSEAAVTVNEPKGGQEVDITMDRGRIRLVNGNADGVVRIRIQSERNAWRVNLEPGSEVVAVLLRRYSTGAAMRGESRPQFEMALYQPRGRLCVSSEGGPGGTINPPAEFIENGAGGATFGAGVKSDEAWVQYRPGGPALAALCRLSNRLTEKTSVEKALHDGLESTDAADQSLAVRCLGAIDAVPAVLNALAAEGEDHAPARRAAIATLRQWVRHGHDQELLLYDPKTEKGLLLKPYGPHDAECIMAILKGFSDDDRYHPGIYKLLANDRRDTRMGVRETAYWQLLHLAAGMKLPEYNAAWPRDRLDKAPEDWKKLIDDGVLPPRSAP